MSIVRAVAVSPIPGAPALIEGAVNWHGTPVPLIDLRRRLGFEPRGQTADQVFVLLRSRQRLLAIRVDDVEEVVELPENGMLPPENLSPALRGLVGIAPLESGALVLYDVDAFLTQAENDALDLLPLLPALAG